MTICADIKKYSISLGLSLMLLGLGQNNARALNLPDVPLSEFSSVEHNVLLTFDDSGSMERGYLPDGLGGTSRMHCSATVNGIAYDPNITYTPPPVRTYPGNMAATPVNMPDADFANAPINGFIAGAATVDLSNAGPATTATHQKGYKPVWELSSTSGALGANTYATCGIASSFMAAFYYVYDPALAGTTNPDTGGACPAVPVTTDQDCYRRVQHGNASYGGNWTAAQQTNFANWYAYYRTRNLAAKSAAGRAFRGFDTNVRIAGQDLNNSSATGGPASGISFTNTTSTNTTNVMKRFCDDPANTDSFCTDGSTARTDFFTRLYNTPAGSTTPLRAAMKRAGDSFGSGNKLAYSPYRATPGAAVSAANPELSCRKNFHIMMTDGYWNSSAGIASDSDSTSHTLGDGSTLYTPIVPYKETPARAGTLADNAFEYWYKDLRPDLTNNVKASESDATGTAAQRYWNPVNNPATWQHMQTFTIGLGIAGTRNPANYFNTALPNSAGDWDELKSGALSWPNPLDAEDEDRIDDLWHAAVNGRGKYFSAKNPDDLTNAFNQIIGQINAITGTAAGLGTSGSTTTTSGGGTSIYQVAYDTGPWTGQLVSKRVDAGGVPDQVNWEASFDGLNTQDYDSDRNIFTYNPSNIAGARGVRFRWSDLNATQQAALNKDSSNVTDGHGSARLDYLRGASANEGSGNPVNASSYGFRVRNCYSARSTLSSISPGLLPTCPANKGKLGDIIDSSPVYVGKPNFGYPDTLESVKYSDFVTAQSGRTKMVYVGANDGMLHGFDNADGKEKMAYVPNLVYSNITQNNLSLLTAPFYSHRFYVNGTPTVGDVFIGGAWRTVLVGGLRKGGKGYFALDITDPSDFGESTSNAHSLVKWEFTDADLGYSYSQATIIKMANNQWAAVFGNGYNNTGTGRAMIYVVNIDTGALIQKIDTGVSGGGGTVLNPNGMASPAVIDINDDYIADYIYAGDMLGKMWRIDVRSPTPANWALAANVNPLFTATDGAVIPAVQPITTQPSVGFHPLGYSGLMVYFGTGKYLENNDNASAGVQQVQSFYGIYDRGVTGRSTDPSLREAVPMNKADLLQQTISATVDAVGTFSTRNISNNTINWRLDRVSTTTHLGWYVDLPAAGEKQVTNSLLREDRIIFTTLIPNPDACNPGGTGWLMVLNTENGGQLKETFDLNGDGIFNADDNNGLAYGAAGALPTGGGSLSNPIVLTNPPSAPGVSPACKETVESVDSNGVIAAMKVNCKPAARESWRQIR